MSLHTCTRGVLHNTNLLTWKFTVHLLALSPKCCMYSSKVLSFILPGVIQSPHTLNMIVQSLHHRGISQTRKCYKLKHSMIIQVDKSIEIVFNGPSLNIKSTPYVKIKFSYIIHLMTFDKVDTMIYQPRRSEWPRWLSLLGLINIVWTDIKSQQLFY